MDVRMRIGVASPGLNVAAFCRAQGISRETFYVWRRRFAADGWEGLEARSRAPLSTPRRLPAAVEDAIVGLRKELEEVDGDNGPSTIQWHLRRRGVSPLPSEATIWRVLTRRGFITPEPRKRPKSSFIRFEATAPNELWQADCTDWVIATGPVKILSFLDDHSRVALRVKALPSATTEATWAAFSEACERWGLPLGQLTDNGLNFSGKLRGFEVFFETQLRAAGVVPKTSRPFHPQTCGKVERFQQSMKNWLRRRPLARDLAELQAQLDKFVDYYNQRRPHRGIGRITPAERWAQTTPAQNPGVPIPAPDRVVDAVVGATGVLELGRYRLHVGTTWARQAARIVHDDTHIAVFIDHQLVHARRLDPTRRYQPRLR